MTIFRYNHYVPRWLQRRFLDPFGVSQYHYLDLRPDMVVRGTQLHSALPATRTNRDRMLGFVWRSMSSPGRANYGFETARTTYRSPFAELSVSKFADVTPVSPKRRPPLKNGRGASGSRRGWPLPTAVKTPVVLFTKAHSCGLGA
ncbi:MAG: hypothetical protein IPJ78_02405 [Gemmatimonadetes bacterium]|nr:hypothetical protein [Gemmatimonadota bacterium]